MNHYEELGIRADADAEDIRKAHRRLVKLVHPDQQPDPDMKLLAETQMRRLNTIVATLLDPAQRGEYDEALRTRYFVQPEAGRSWRGMPLWLVSSVAAILTVGAVWIWADHLGSSVSRSPVSIPPREMAKASVPALPTALPDPLPLPTPNRRPAVVLPALAPKRAIPKTDSQPETKSSASPGNTFAGEWVYAPKEPENHKAGFYSPEFIDFKLSQQHQGGLQGQYSARYQVPSATQPISPDVNFQVVATGKDVGKFVWHSSNGSRGTLAVHDIDGRTIRIEWRTTVSSGPPALTSGIATLVRRE
jgi:hypothetical protein